MLGYPGEQIAGLAGSSYLSYRYRYLIRDVFNALLEPRINAIFLPFPALLYLKCYYKHIVHNYVFPEYRLNNSLWPRGRKGWA